MLAEAGNNITTSLALGGLIVSGLIAVFLAILKLKIFPRLNRELGERVISQMMLYLFILALIGIILGFIGYVLPTIKEMLNGQTKAEVEKKTMEFPVDERWTLKSAITEIARGKGRSVKFTNCDDAVMNTKLRSDLVRGSDTTALIKNLQDHRIGDISKELYQINLVEEGRYEITCNQ